MAESKLFHEIASLRTEQKNPRTELIDIASTKGILELINNEDLTVAQAVRNELKDIETAVDLIVSAFKNGGRLFYFGAGTSGRLGILDASECPPTFGTNPEMVQGIIAGGEKAVFKAQEGAEDSRENGAIELDKYNIKPPDIICGIAASGRTPFVAGALEEAKKRNIRTILVTTVSKETVNELGIVADVLICANVGPEVITGSTRMKSGTATKMILNMLTTASMVKLGKTFGNVMVDLQLTNNKLLERAKRIIMQITECDYDTATHYLEQSGGHVKTALVMILGNLSKQEATELLGKADGFVRKALK
ncbi:MAG: N-acetylmuramic acid 6-phosphate etherase [Bacteroidota bacterium]